jgi:hypothetical protein
MRKWKQQHAGAAALTSRLRRGGIRLLSADEYQGCRDGLRDLRAVARARILKIASSDSPFSFGFRISDFGFPLRESAR